MKIFRVTTYSETKNIQNCLKIDATHFYNNDLLLRKETQKILGQGVLVV